MCVMSAVIDTWRDDWGKRFQPLGPYLYPDYEGLIDKVQREQLKKEIEEFRAILKRARAWDKAHPQEEPCDETPQKIEALRELVRQLGLEDEVEVVLKEIEEEDGDNTEPPATTVRVTTIPRTVTSSGTGRIGSISVGGPGYYDDPSAYT